jgi:hypothetical protein
MMPNIGRSGHVGGKKSLQQGCGRRCRKDIKAIFTLIGKKNFLGGEILDIENRRVKFKKDNFHNKIVEQIVVFF